MWPEPNDIKIQDIMQVRDYRVHMKRKGEKKFH